MITPKLRIRFNRCKQIVQMQIKCERPYCKEIFKITFYYIVFNSLKVEKNKQAVLINSGLK